MDDRRQDRRLATMEPWGGDGDGLTREPLPPEPRSPWLSWSFPQSTGTRVLLGALAALLVVTVVGTTALVIRDLHMQPSQTTTHRPSVSTTATATVAPTTITPPRSPQDNGWTAFTPAVWGGDVKFSQSSPQRGYLCGQGPNDRVFAVTADGGQMWQVSSSPAQYSGCSLQVSAVNPLDVVVTSYVDGAGQFISVDAHYSADGGKTWKAAPLPQDTQIPGGAVWSGSYLYVWVGHSMFGPQNNSLQASANGGPFTSIDPNGLVPGAQNLAIGSAVASGTKLYLNLTYNGCSSQNCQAIVASGDGGKHWTQIPNESDIQLMYVSGSTLYGQAPDPQVPQILAEWTSSDNGATWTQLKLPLLPGGLPAPFCLPAPDGTLFGAPDFVGVAYLRAGSWTVLPLSTYGEHIQVAVSLDTSGKPKVVWAVDDGNDSWAGIYWHALP